MNFEPVVCTYKEHIQAIINDKDFYKYIYVVQQDTQCGLNE